MNNAKMTLPIYYYCKDFSFVYTYFAKCRKAAFRLPGKTAGRAQNVA